MRAMKVILLSSIALASPAFSSSTTTYTYDALGRLTATANSGTVNNGVAMATTYDAADNRVTYAVTGSKPKVIVVPLNGFTVIPILDN